MEQGVLLAAFNKLCFFHSAITCCYPAGGLLPWPRGWQVYWQLGVHLHSIHHFRAAVARQVGTAWQWHACDTNPSQRSQSGGRVVLMRMRRVMFVPCGRLHDLQAISTLQWWRNPSRPLLSTVR